MFSIVPLGLSIICDKNRNRWGWDKRLILRMAFGKAVARREN